MPFYCMTYEDLKKDVITQKGTVNFRKHFILRHEIKEDFHDLYVVD